MAKTVVREVTCMRVLCVNSEAGVRGAMYESSMSMTKAGCQRGNIRGCSMSRSKAGVNSMYGSSMSMAKTYQRGNMYASSMSRTKADVRRQHVREFYVYD